jgi:hypothetical protein
MSSHAIQPPAYFAAVSSDATETWTLLRKRPDIKGAWNHLFRQIQNPRFVISELLQNADDAGATVAEVTLTEDEFIFAHDGKDFNADQFASLCRFGFSNKRALHTIGFRGIGFKSTFSLGSRVEVWSPSLGVAFDKEHFTEPRWIHDGREVTRTLIRVAIGTPNAYKEVHDSVLQWCDSPTSLLFFGSIRKLILNGEVIERKESGSVIPHTRKVELLGKTKQFLHVLRSDEVEFPPEVLAEIKEERDTTDLHLGSCKVEVVLGLRGKQHLFAVLPTVEDLALPFSINAPFLLKPDRFDVKANSVTNRWLLQRAADLVAEVIVAWLSSESLSEETRSDAYRLLPNAQAAMSAPAAKLVFDLMIASLSKRAIILNCYGKLIDIGAVSVPAGLFDIWSAKQIREFLAPSSQLLSPSVGVTGRNALASHGWIREISPHETLEQMATRSDLPQPETWQKLGAFWAFVIEHQSRYDYDHSTKRRIPLVPVTGQNDLKPASTVVRVSTRADALSADTIEWLTQRTPVLDLRWTEWLAKQESKYASPMIELLKALQLGEPTPSNRLVEQTAASVLARKNVKVGECVQLAQLFASLKANTPKGFQFVTRDFYRRSSEKGIVFDPSGIVTDLAPAAWAKEHVLHEDYEDFQRCTKEDWFKWVASPASGLHLGFPVQSISPKFYSRSSLNKFLATRDASTPREYYNQRDSFMVRDFALDDDLVAHWSKLAVNDSTVWQRVLELILSSPSHGSKDTLLATAYQERSNNFGSLVCGAITTQWITVFRSKPCLPDTHGRPCLPSEVYLRSPDTEPLLTIEKFVRAELDNDATKPLLRALGVLSSPADFNKIVARLEAMHGVQISPLVHNQINTLYLALDRIVARCSSVDRATLQDLFRHKPLILAADNTWETSGELSIFPGEDEPGDGAAIVHPAFQSLSMWPRLSVAERPSTAKALDWLQTLESGQKLDGATFTRVRRALSRDAQRIWEECGHWLSLDSTWEPVERFVHRLTLQALSKSANLSPSVRQTVADLRPIPTYLCGLLPFVKLTDLGEAVEYRVTRVEAAANARPVPAWLAVLAAGLRRIKLADADKQVRVRKSATRLSQSSWHSVTALEVTPYIANTPAGVSAPEKVVWSGQDVYVTAGSPGRLHRLLVEELSRPFEQNDISNAFGSCAERTPDFVEDYLIEHFMLDEIELPLPDASDSEPLSNIEHEVRPPTDFPEDDLQPIPTSTLPIDDTPENVGTNPEDSRPEQAPAPKPRPAPEPSLFDRYAVSKGFKASGNGYTHPNGFMIVKSAAPFDWELVNAKGERVRRYWTTKETLEKGIEVDAELWNLTRQAPDQTSWVVANGAGTPSALSGKELMAKTGDEFLLLFPSRYRLLQKS